jgi:hypothetical protein
MRQLHKRLPLKCAQIATAIVPMGHAPRRAHSAYLQRSIRRFSHLDFSLLVSRLTIAERSFKSSLRAYFTPPNTLNPSKGAAAPDHLSLASLAD